VPETFLTALLFTVEACACTAGRASAWAPRLSTRNAQRRNGQSIVRRTTSGAAGNELGTSIKYLRRTTSGAAGNGLSRCQELFMCPFTACALRLPFLVRASFTNKQNSTFKGWGFGASVYAWNASSLLVFKKNLHQRTFFLSMAQNNMPIFFLKKTRITFARPSLPVEPPSERASCTPRSSGTTRAT
jgi:hypothetical protein